MTTKITKDIITLFILAFLLIPIFAKSQLTAPVTAPGVAPEINSGVVPGVNSEMAPGIIAPVHPPVKFVPEVESGVTNSLESKKLYIISSKEVTYEVEKEIGNLEIRPGAIFSPVFSEVTNLTVNPIVENEKVIYKLELPVNTSIYKGKEVIQPIFDLRVEKPIRFRIKDQRVEIGDEQIIDYKEILSEVKDKEVFPPINIEVQSAISNEIHNLKVVPQVNSAVFKLIYKEKEVQMPVYSDFKVESKKLYLTENDKVYDLKVLPPEVYSGVHDAVAANPKSTVESLDLKIVNDKPVYDLRVKEPFKLLWIIPMEVENKYVIDPSDGSIIERKKPWYAIFGGFGKLHFPSMYKL